MKKTMALIIGAILAIAVINASAQTNVQGDAFITFRQSMDAKNITVAISPSYAPDLKNDAGKTDPWGAGLSLTYRPSADGVLAHTFLGTQLDYIGSEFLAVSVAGGLRADFQILGVNCTTFGYVGAVKAVKRSDETDLGSMAGTGVKTTVKTWPSLLGVGQGSLDVGGAVEKWQKFDGQVYRVGVALTVRW